MAETTRTVTIARVPFTLEAGQVERAMQDFLPEPVKDHFVVVNRRRYPPKQVLLQVTGLDRADFTTHHARRILTGLGFPAGRRTCEPETDEAHVRAPIPASGRSAAGSAPLPSRPSAETLEPFMGQWVATRGAEVLVAAPQPRTVVGWLAQHDQQADSMFRVPGSENEASGAAPL